MSRSILREGRGDSLALGLWAGLTLGVSKDPRDGVATRLGSATSLIRRIKRVRGAQSRGFCLAAML